MGSFVPVPLAHGSLRGPAAIHGAAVVPGGGDAAALGRLPVGPAGWMSGVVNGL